MENGNIFDEISKMNLPFNELKDSDKDIKGALNNLDDIMNTVHKIWHKTIDKDQKEFKTWAKDNVDYLEKMYQSSNMRNLVIDYISHIASNHPEIMNYPDACLKIAFGAFVYGYYASKIKNL